MTLRNSLLQPLFDAANSREPISNEQLLELKSLITTIQINAAHGEDISINDTNSDGDTALIIAARRNREEIIQLLLNAKAKPNILNRFGISALWEAAEKSHLKNTQMLLEAGALIEDGNKYTALDRAVDLHFDALQDRFDNAIDLTDNLSIICALLKHGAFIHNPQKAFEFFSYCDARDPNLLDALHFLHEHLKQGYGSPSQSLLDNVKQFIEQLDELTESHKNDIKAADITMDTILPTELKNLVYSYVAPLERLGFFSRNNPLTEEKTQPGLVEEQSERNISEEKIEPAPSKSSCSMM